MIFGDINTFAIKIAVTERSGDWVFGNVCFIMCNEEIGDFDQEISVGTVFNHLHSLRWMTNFRERPELALLDSSEVFKKIDEAIYGGGVASQEDQERYAGLEVLCGGFVSLDRWKGFLIENGPIARMVVQFPSGGIKEFRWKSGFFDKVVKQAAAFLDDEIFPFVDKNHNW